MQYSAELLVWPEPSARLRPRDNVTLSLEKKGDGDPTEEDFGEAMHTCT